MTQRSINEATVQLQAYLRLAKQDIGQHYTRSANTPWSGVENHLTVGLGDARPDISECFHVTDYPSTAVDELGEALAPSDYDKAMPALAVELERSNGRMDKATARCGYDGALMVNGAHAIHKYLGRPDDAFFSTTQALTIAYDGCNLQLFGHHVPVPQPSTVGSPTLEYHQYILATDNPRASLEDFRMAYRHMRNAQDIGYNLAKKRKDALCGPRNCS